MNIGQNTNFHLVKTSSGKTQLFEIISGKLQRASEIDVGFELQNGKLFGNIFIPNNCSAIGFIRTCSKCNYKKGRLQLTTNLNSGALIFSVIPKKPGQDELSKHHFKVDCENILDAINEGYRIKKNSSGYIALNPERYGSFSELGDFEKSEVSINFPIVRSNSNLYYAIFNDSFLYFISSVRA